MSHCWCKCEAGLGQCGPKVPKLKSLFAAHKQSDEASLRRGDRQAELQIIWEDVGEDKQSRMEELKQQVAEAVDKLYDRALEEAVRKRTALEESVATSEQRLRESLGPDAAQAIAPKALPLQERQEHNLARLQELDSQKIGGFGWVGGLFVVAELRRRIAALHRTLGLPAPDKSASPDEMLQALAQLQSLRHPARSPLVRVPVSPQHLGPKGKGDQKPIFQRLETFYSTLCTMERTWAESFASKAQTPFDSDASMSDSEESSDEEMDDGEERLDEGAAERTVKLRLRELGEQRAERHERRQRSRKRSSSSDGPVTPGGGSSGLRIRGVEPLASPLLSQGGKKKRSKNKIFHRRSSDDHGDADPFGNGGGGLDDLAQKVLRKLDSLTEQAVLRSQDDYDDDNDDDGGGPGSATMSPRAQAIAGSFLQPVYRPPSAPPSGSTTPSRASAVTFHRLPPPSPQRRFGYDSKRSSLSLAEEAQGAGAYGAAAAVQAPPTPKRMAHTVAVAISPFLLPPAELLAYASRFPRSSSSPHLSLNLSVSLTPSSSSSSCSSASLAPPAPAAAAALLQGAAGTGPGLAGAGAGAGAGSQRAAPPLRTSSGLLDVLAGAPSGGGPAQVMQRARPAEDTMASATVGGAAPSPPSGAGAGFGGGSVNGALPASAPGLAPAPAPGGSGQAKPAKAEETRDPWAAFHKGKGGSSKAAAAAQAAPDKGAAPPAAPPKKDHQSLSSISLLVSPPGGPSSAAGVAPPSPKTPPPPPPPRRDGRPGVPPPPPPPPPGLGGRSIAQALKAQNKSRLKRSSKMGHLYRGLKGRLASAAAGQAVAGGGLLDEASEGAAVALPAGGGGAKQGSMADALAEITRKSSYFKKIEEDVQKHSDAIWQAKTALETFRTTNMEELLAFHRRMENLLEMLTDESQVLARFEGFPSKKLETVRMAAGLYSRLATLVRDITGWTLSASTLEELQRITKYFDKMKKEVEAVDRTREDDAQRFTAHKITFNFAVVAQVKEATVKLSARILSMAIEESKKLRYSVDLVDGQVSPTDLPRVRSGLQTLWHAFQFSFRVYNFAGGQDDEADNAAMALATEMECYPSEAW